jgi:ABC-type nickel/cobalt efflux system permease component RcnA
VTVGKVQADIRLMIPTGLVGMADDDRNGQLSATEILAHRTTLQTTLAQRIRLTNHQLQPGQLTLQPTPTLDLPASLPNQPKSHSTLNLRYQWATPIQTLRMDYNLFLPGVPTARCLATITHGNGVQNVIFSPEQRTATIGEQHTSLLSNSFWAAILGAFVWGALHSLSPGHGKTIVGAYLVGSKATAQHAFLLGLTTTVTHTLGVFVLGLVTLFASQYILPEQLLPWLSLISGLMIVCLGWNLVRQRFRSIQWFKPMEDNHSLALQGSTLSIHSHHDGHWHTHTHHAHAHTHDGKHFHTHESIGHTTHDHDHHHPHDHHHDHDHDHHFLPSLNGAPIHWRNLLMLGISGGLLPCPSALVLLLSAITIGQVGYGLVLVLAFSLGLACVLTGLGLLLLYARRLFTKFPKRIGLIGHLPTVSALLIFAIGIGLTVHALTQMPRLMG